MYECPNHKRHMHGECFNKLNRKAGKACKRSNTYELMVES